MIAIHALPDGENINDGCGSTHLDGLREAVRAEKADLGIAHDGDADRCLAIDADGEVVDGDQIMAVLALAMKESGELAEDTLVATVMSNLGLHLAMREHDITLRTTAVGDRYVLEELREGGLSLGGEQSGHVVLPAHATTGDGLLTAMRLMARMAATVPPAGRPGRRDDPPAAGPGEREGGRQGRGGHVRLGVLGGGRGRGRAGRDGPRAAPPVRAPSSSSGSWSRPRPTRWPAPLPSGSQAWSHRRVASCVGGRTIRVCELEHTRGGPEMAEGFDCDPASVRAFGDVFAEASEQVEQVRATLGNTSARAGGLR